MCVSGDETGRETVLLIGDSHATPWVPLLDSLGIEHGYAVAVRSLVGCPAADVSVAGLGGARYAACDTFHAETLALITKLKPDVVLLANSNSYIGAILDTHGGVTEEHAQAASWENGYRTVVQTAQSAGARVIAIEDTFRPIGNPAVCMTRPLGSLERCEPDRATAMRPVETLMDVERVVQDDLGIETLTFNERLCTAAKCSIADGHVPIFRDASHISQAWAVEQADQVQALIGQF